VVISSFQIISLKVLFNVIYSIEFKVSKVNRFQQSASLSNVIIDSDREDSNVILKSPQRLHLEHDVLLHDRVGALLLSIIVCLRRSQLNLTNFDGINKWLDFIFCMSSLLLIEILLIFGICRIIITE